MKDECQWSEMERKLQIKGAPNMQKQGITNMLALPIDKMLYIYYSVHTQNTKKIHSNLNSLNTFT